MPITPNAAVDHVRSWHALPYITVPEPGPPHLAILSGLLEDIGAAGKLTPNAVLAAIAIEYQAELFSNDSDFSRFSGLKWRNPLKDA